MSSRCKQDLSLCNSLNAEYESRHLPQLSPRRIWAHNGGASQKVSEIRKSLYSSSSYPCLSQPNDVRVGRVCKRALNFQFLLGHRARAAEQVMIWRRIIDACAALAMWNMSHAQPKSTKRLRESAFAQVTSMTVVDTSSQASISPDPQSIRRSVKNSQRVKLVRPTCKCGKHKYYLIPSINPFFFLSSSILYSCQQIKVVPAANAFSVPPSS